MTKKTALPVGDQDAFRKWLILRVEGTRYATMPMTDTQLERYAEKLGVIPEVLLQARVNMRLRLASAGVPPPGVSTYGNRCRVILCFSREHWEEWTRHLEDWGCVEGDTLVRSLIHEYLQGSYEPEHVSRFWIWQGAPVPVVRGGPCREKVMISRGARGALMVRSAMRGCSIMAILRALVIENMAGKFGRRGLLKLVDLRSMYEDQERYFLAD